MRAFVMTRYGGADAAEIRDDIPMPEVGPNDVLVKVHAAGLNPVDFKIREGKLKAIKKVSFPAVMGNEIAGVVESVGSAVTAFHQGQRVYARLDKDAMGGIAEYVAVNQDILARMPASLTFEAAAAVPLAGLTALQALRDELHLKPGYKVFISAGAGGVGTFAIQIAKHLGAYVATTASPRGDALVRSLGADEVIDYTSTKFEDVLHEYDGAFDLIGGDDLLRTFKVVRKGATVVSISAVPEPVTATKDLGRGKVMAALFWLVSRKVRKAAAALGVKYRFLFMHPSRSDLELFAKLIDDGTVYVIVDKVFPFAESPEAFAYLESGRAKGKVVIDMGGA